MLFCSTLLRDKLRGREISVCVRAHKSACDSEPEREEALKSAHPVATVVQITIHTRDGGRGGGEKVCG